MLAEGIAFLFKNFPEYCPKLYRECFRRGCHPVRYREASNPIISFDTKKKEVLGNNLYRPGTLYTKEPVTTLDHDFWSLGHRKVMTHGVYYSQQSRGYITLGNSKDTSEIACEALKKWWNNYGNVTYPNANSILAKCDGGGSNNANHYIFK